MRSLIDDETYKFTKNIVQKKHCQMYSIAYIVKIIKHISLLHIDAFLLSFNTVYLYQFFPLKQVLKVIVYKVSKESQERKKSNVKKLLEVLDEKVYKIHFIF